MRHTRAASQGTYKALVAKIDESVVLAGHEGHLKQRLELASEIKSKQIWGAKEAGPNVRAAGSVGTEAHVSPRRLDYGSVMRVERTRAQSESTHRVAGFCEQRGRRVDRGDSGATSRLWEEGTSSSTFFPVKISVAMKWHLA
jgi:hypothetical protein